MASTTGTMSSRRSALRFNSGLSQIDSLRGTGLESINDKSSRWTMPITFGIRVNF